VALLFLLCSCIKGIVFVRVIVTLLSVDVVAKVVAHETCHLFYFAHCVFFDCLMNDSRSVAEAMAQPLHLCPVCTRKLHKVLRLRSVSEHHRSLLTHLSSLIGFDKINIRRMVDEVEWLRRCVAVSGGTEER
jgi:archaemetzincin